jgi:hypothetical protein
MPYVTIPLPDRQHQITFDEILAGEIDIRRFVTHPSSSATWTRFLQRVPKRLSDTFGVEHAKNVLEGFNSKYEALRQVPRQSLYDTFHLPKRSGGLRQIDAPLRELMEALRELKRIFEDEFIVSHHTAAYAYVRHRCTRDALVPHQRMGSWWFLKTDFSNFFGSSTPEFIHHMLALIFPFNQMYENEACKEELVKALDLCFLNGGLPQGTPISPMLTNIMMIPIDYLISKTLRDFDHRQFTYTRYADDLLISCRIDFNKEKVINQLRGILRSFNAPFDFKDEKTRYGSSAGSNWNLGLILNRNNEITIGHKNKKRFHAMVANYILDRQHDKTWDLHDVQVLHGRMSYYKMVEPEYVAKVIDFNNNKFNADVQGLLIADLRGAAA